MHTDNLTSKGIKEILVYSASHHAAWQIINNFKSILWYKYSQGPGRWPSTSHISHSTTPRAHQTSKKGFDKTTVGKEWRAIMRWAAPLLQPGEMQDSHRNPPVSRYSTHLQSLRGQGHSVCQEVLPCQLARSLRDTRCRSNHLPFPAKEGCWA